jgi:uncharacterized protein (TIGR02145 family)
MFDPEQHTSKMNTGTRTFISFLIPLFSLILFSCTSEPSEGAIEDIDGNIYQTVKIGKQIWMAENLRVTTFNDGEPIPLVTSGHEWYNLRTAAYCWYNNDSTAFSNPFGALYNYHAINTGRLCPPGWRIPTQQDFQTLISALDPDANFIIHETSTKAGGMLKAIGTNYWAEPNTAATNESGFSALPGGCRSWAGNFSMMNAFGYYGSTPDNSSLAVRFATGSAFMRSEISGYVGVSIRCVKKQ